MKQFRVWWLGSGSSPPFVHYKSAISSVNPACPSARASVKTQIKESRAKSEWGLSNLVPSSSSQPCRMLKGVWGWTLLQPQIWQHLQLSVSLNRTPGDQEGRDCIRTMPCLRSIGRRRQSMEGGGRPSKVPSSEGLREGGGGSSVIWESLLFFWRPREREECLWAELLRQLLTFTHNKNTESYFCKLSSYSLLITLKL